MKNTKIIFAWFVTIIVIFCIGGIVERLESAAQFVGHKVSGFLNPATEDLDMDGNNIKTGTGWIGRDASGLTFDASNNIVATNDIDANNNDLILGTGQINFDGVTGEGLRFDTLGTASFYVATNIKWNLESSRLWGYSSAGPALMRETVSATNPTLIPRADDPATGMGSPAVKQFSLTANSVEIARGTQDTNIAEFRILGSLKIDPTDVNASTYSVLQTDHYLQCRRTATGALTVTLPAISTVGDGFIIVIKDSGYNANNFNITVSRTGSDTINNVAGNYTINTAGTAAVFMANATTTDWEIY